MREPTSGGTADLRAGGHPAGDGSRAGGGFLDVILADYDLRGFGALRDFALLKERARRSFIIVSDTIGEETAVRAIKAGAHNCIPMESLRRLGPTVMELREIRRERRLVPGSRDSETRFRTLVETASDAILTVDEQGRILFANRAAERIFGHPVGSMLGEPVAMLLPDCPPLSELGARKAGGGPGEPAPAETAELSGLHARGESADVSTASPAGRLHPGSDARDATERKKSGGPARVQERLHAGGQRWIVPLRPGPRHVTHRGSGPGVGPNPRRRSAGRVRPTGATPGDGARAAGAGRGSLPGNRRGREPGLRGGVRAAPRPAGRSGRRHRGRDQRDARAPRRASGQPVGDAVPDALPGKPRRRLPDDARRKDPGLQRFLRPDLRLRIPRGSPRAAGVGLPARPRTGAPRSRA